MRKLLITLTALFALLALTITAAHAAPIANGTGPELVSDQQDVLLNSDGQAKLDFRQGVNNNQCLSARAYVFFTPVRNVSPPGISNGRSPVLVQAGQNTNCNLIIVVLDKDNHPMRSQRVRLAYLAVVNGTADIPALLPAPLPTPAPTTTTAAP